MNPSAFTHPQASLAVRLGLAPEKIADWRAEHLIPGTDFLSRRGQPTLWTGAAVSRLYAAFNLQVEVQAAPAEKTAAANPAGQPALPPFAPRQILTAWGPAGHNTRILLCHFAGVRPETRDELLRVQVKNAARWRRGQPVPATWQNGNLWHHDPSVTETITIP